ncbi:beta-1 adrenergic receptor-like [Actinia tenebrosa]|uniref:Beta-1 adrenergic receptor-like n=1 Tax=Actinia tenebrosa TaxID=6105 RepID=A0A6P8I0N7_ACTTE|nr:beta-1 adrenergic receptor-like [Actinia tenebrosa]
MAPSNSSSLLNSKSLEQMRHELSSRDIPLVIAESFLLASISLASLLGNILVLMAIYKSPRLKSPTNYLIISLAWGNLLTALIVVPMSTGVLATGKMFMGVQGCKAFGCMTYLLSNITFYTIGLIAFNRFLLALSPKWYDFFFSTKSTIMTIVSSWVFQFIYAVLPAVTNWSEVFLMPGYTTCALFVTNPAAKVIYRTQSELQMIGGFIIIIMCYTVVLIKIRKTHLIFPEVEASTIMENPRDPQRDPVDQCSRSSRYLTPDVPNSPVTGVTKRRMTSAVCLLEKVPEESTVEKEHDALDQRCNTAGKLIQGNSSDNPDAGKSGDHVKTKDYKNVVPSDFNQEASKAHKYHREESSHDGIGSDSDAAPSDANQVDPELEAQESPADVADSSKSDPQHPHRFLSQMKTTKLLFAITLFFLLSWVPLAVTIVVESYQSEYLSRQVELFGITLLYLGTTFNPVILPIMSRHFRTEFLKMLCIRNAVAVRPQVSAKPNV